MTAALELQHFRQAALALGYRDDAEYELAADAANRTIDACTEVLGSVDPARTELAGSEAAGIVAAVICIDSVACRLLRLPDKRVSHETLVRFALWTVREWVRDNDAHLSLSPTAWAALTAEVAAIRSLPLGAPARLQKIHLLCATLRDAVTTPPALGSELDDLVGFIAVPMTVPALAMLQSDVHGSTLSVELVRARVAACNPMEYNDPSHGFDTSDAPENRELEERLLPHCDVMVIVHGSPASGLGSVDATARAWRIPRVLARRDGRISPRLTGAVDPPVQLPLDDPDWARRVVAWIDGNRSRLVTERRRREARLHSATERLETFRLTIAALPHTRLAAPWPLSMTPAELLALLKFPELFARLSPEDVDEIVARLGGDGLAAGAAAVGAEYEQAARFLPPLEPLERKAREAVARRRRWSPRMAARAELIARASKTLPSGSHRNPLSDLTSPLTWIQIEAELRDWR